ncbi:MAG: hypothetical protein F6K39_40785 [Okeania sp. SIO3B3]|nr:hypothetical protein [Okeania sp. SIO3B3]
MWKRLLCNACEPDNILWIQGYEDNNIIKADNFYFSGRFNDGDMSLDISKLDSGKFRFVLDGDITICDTLEDALSMMPSFLSSPDHFEDGKLIDISEYTNLT